MFDILGRPKGVAILASAATAAIIASISPSYAQEQARTFDIAPQPLSSALIEFSRQAGVRVTADPDVINGRQAPLVRGTYTSRAALEALLSGSGLRIEQTASGGYAVQASPPTRLGAVDETTPGATEEEVIVTGTRLRGDAPRSSPLTIYDRQSIEETGAASLRDFVRTLPENLASNDDTTSPVGNQADLRASNSFYGGSVNLHGLGSGSTLTLLNGRRLAPAGSGGFVDISMIPLAAIERVEVLSDGASAIYGSDAIAGVVNFILRRDFEGAQSAVRYGDSTRGGGREYAASQLIGTSWENGSLMGSYEHYHRDAISSTQRSFVPPSTFGPEGFEISPEQTTNSGFVALNLEIAPTTSVHADVLYTARDTFQLSSYPTLVNANTINASQTSIVFGIDHEFSSSWTGSLALNFSQIDQTTDQDGTFGPFSGSTVAELASIGAHVTGTPLRLPGGDVRIAFGVETRSDRLEDTTIGAPLSRRVASAFAETLVPIFGPDNAAPLLERLELTAAIRHDDYRGVGAASRTTPKFGVFWQPLDGLGVRGTYGESFRVANLSELGGLRSYFTFDTPDASAPDGFRNTLFYSGGNPDLQPETSRAITYGFDYTPRSLDGLRISATYFDIAFDDRIATPPVIGGIFNIYTQTTTLAPFLNFSPSLSEVQDAFDQPGFFGDFAGQGPAGVEAIFDSRLQNVASSRHSGLDLRASYRVESAIGEVLPSISATLVDTYQFQPVSTAPAVDVLNTTFYPAAVRLRGGLGYNTGGFSTALSINYVGAYDNEGVSPTAEVDAWTTADLRFAYSTENNGDSGFTIALNVINLTDEPPPRVDTTSSGADFGFDPANASAIGRFITLSLSKTW